MMTHEDVQLLIERHIDLGEPLSDEALMFINANPDCRDYLDSMRIVADTLSTIEISPPPTLINEVMTHIDRREKERAKLPSQVLVNTRFAPFRDIWAYVSSFQPDSVLWREFWPASIATAAVVIGVFVSPHVQAGKNYTFAETLSDKVVSFTDETFKRAESVAVQVENFASGLIRNATGKTEQTQDSEKKGAMLKYRPSDIRTINQDTAKAA